MKLKTLRPIAAALVVASLTPAAFAETLAEHPAVQVAQSWSSRGIDPNTFIVGHPAGSQVDAQTQAAELLSGSKAHNSNAEFSKLSTKLSNRRVNSDAQAQAAALLRGSTARADAQRTRVSSSKVGF